ncbi:hypothetical protein HPB51_001680 [Rhipicephalus microplus]|uniref:Uncharacterized protein n=1 Tax=Rhipicephalus microplus TaxID=6941 RepID=A0A9J6EVE9_RHIMP|nr:hypothetical protein HPB51_001680 [Rhipicephalus microplus]
MGSNFNKLSLLPGHSSSTSVKTPAENTGTKAFPARLRRGLIPQLPTDDFKVVYHPNVGINEAAFIERELWAALLDSSSLVESSTQDELTRTNVVKKKRETGKKEGREVDHILLFGMPTMSTACHETVAKYPQIRQITLHRKIIAVKAYITPPNRAIQGIIYREHNRESPQEILHELQRSNPLLPIVPARDMGHTSKSMLIHFMSDTFSESVKFFGSAFGVYSFRPKVEACTNCRQTGQHCRDVCPEPMRFHCLDCGQQRSADQQCSPTCIACGGAHKTGDRLCRRRYQRGKTQWGRNPSPHQSQETPDIHFDLTSFPPLHSATGGQTGSRSLKQNKTQVMPTVNEDPQKVSCVGGISHGSSSRSDSRDPYYQSTIDRFTKKNQDLKQQISSILVRLTALTHTKFS